MARTWWLGTLWVVLTALVLGFIGCAEETDGPTPTLSSTLEPPASCNFSTAENAAGSQVLVLRSPDGSFSPMAQDALSDPPGIALPRVYLARDGVEIEVTRVEFVSPSELHAVIDASLALAAGSYQVRVVNPNGKDSGYAATLEIYDPPVIDSIGPLIVCSPGQVVTIVGSGFRDGTTVTLNGVDAGATVVDENTITFTLPEGAQTGDTYEVVVTSPEDCTATATEVITVGGTIFTVESMMPLLGWTGIDNPVTIFGSGFVAGMTVSLVGAAPGGDDWPLSFVSIAADGTAIDAVVPAGAVPGGPYPVRVRAPDGCEVDWLPGFTIAGEPSIVLSAVIPPFGWTGTRTPVTIQGSGFVSTPRAYLVIPDADTTINPNRKLVSTAYLDGETLTSTVPPGLPPGGAYDLVVINPDGGGGLLADAFTVTSLPTPTIDDVSPGSGTTQDATPVTITGCNFRAPLTVELRAPDETLTTAANIGTPSCTGAPGCPGDTNHCTLTATFPTTTLAVGAYVVRLTNEDEGSWGEWSAFVVTNPSAKLEIWQAGSSLTTGRRGHAGVAGRIDNTRRFVYAVGGNGGSPADAFDTVEVVPLDIFGRMGAWFEQRYRLPGPRSDLAAVQLGGYIYAIGGRSDASTALGTVARAKILRDDEAPVVTDPPILVEGTLGVGTWYYVVSAVMASTDPDNPDGESLPSDEVVVTRGIEGGVELEWTPVEGAVTYRVYRTEAPNGISATEVLLAEVAAPTTTYTDDGSGVVDPTQTPLRRGSTGVWVLLGTDQELDTARWDLEAAIAHDPNGAAFVYAVGGSACGACVDYAPLSDDGSTLGAWQLDTSALTEPRTEHALVVAEPLNASQVPAGQAWLLATGGNGVAETLEATSVLAGGGLGVWTAYGPPDGANPGDRWLCEALLINNAFYVVGGRSGNSPLNTIEFSVDFEAGNLPARNTFSSSSNSMLVAREDFALVLESAYLYAIGGSSDGTNAVASVDTVIY